MTNTASTATRYPCPCVASKTVKCTKHVRTVVTVDQAAELNSLYETWLRRSHPEATGSEIVQRLRVANWQSCPPELFGQAKAALESWLA